MRSTYKLYDHRALAWRASDSSVVECRVCGVRVSGYDPATLRHADEWPVKRVPIQPGDLAAVRAATGAVQEALSSLPGDAPPELIADAVIQALYQRGALKVRMASWQRGGHAAA